MTQIKSTKACADDELSVEELRMIAQQEQEERDRKALRKRIEDAGIILAVLIALSFLSAASLGVVHAANGHVASLTPNLTNLGGLLPASFNLSNPSPWTYYADRDEHRRFSVAAYAGQ